MPAILIVDDNADNRNLIAQCLEEEGYRCLEAVDGVEALAAIAREKVDLVLLDLAMPRLDGFGVLRAMGERRGRFLPIVAITAHTERTAKLQALQLGAHEFLPKPIDREELIVRVRTLLALQAAKDEAEGRAQNLEALVREKTVELAARNAQLEAADRHKDEFLSVISHELRTPLNFIMGFASILEDGIQGPLTAEQEGSVAKILQGAERMLRLVNDLLEYAKLTSGRFELECLDQPYDPVLHQVIESLLPLAAIRGVKLKVSGSAPVFRFDAQRVIQVLTNLIDNALKYSPPGETVRVEVSRIDGAVETRIVDAGPGVPAALRAQIFERFRQGDMSTTRVHGGTGLGLAISKAIVEAHGGAIGVEARPRGGSVFWFRLPLIAQEAETPLLLDAPAGRDLC